ncbi:non-ribosomal peptide synthetase [Streptomyces olivochromogenes]|uniref:non-ribosomal peptide synthetase n=1 Tax=Streptomyces olivochromogenes TaxID=1963 RepID=UPI001F3679B1|nr:amino acid adenylation domain-containing protein [Streptomyces olivochromogenes]
MIAASSAQRRMYFSWILRPDDTADIWKAVLSVGGDLSMDRLERALMVLYRRHDALRTTYLERNGEVLQVVRDADAFRVAIEVVEAEGESSAERRDWADAEAARRVAAPIDLAVGPVGRVIVIRIFPDLHLMAFVFHHIVMDEISAQVFAEELRLAYADPDAPALAEPISPYSDFCSAEQLAGLDREGLDHWLRQLAGVQPARLLEDGAENPAGAVGRRLPVPLPADVAAEFEVFCKEQSITPFTGLLAVYFILLRRWSGASDVTVGAQMLGRPHAEFFRTIGFFANTVVLRSQVRSTPTFTEFVAGVGDTVQDALDYQDVPFDVVVDALAPQRDADRNPLFQANIEYDTIDPTQVWALDGLQVAAVPDPADQTGLHFILNLRVQRPAGELAVTVEYDRRRFSDAAMQRFAEAYGSLLKALIRTPGAPLGSIPMLDEDGLARTLALGAGEETSDGAAAGRWASGWELFETTAAATPDREAVRAGAECATFAELADRARTMAVGLRARGVRTGTVVGICLHRRLDLIAAMLATWCAGGAFSLLDAQQPEDRRRMLLAEAGVTLLIADESFAEVATVSVAGLGADAASAATASGESGFGGARRPAAAPAYVVFTSGSTGKPKGVVVDQAGVVALAATQLARMYSRLPAGRQANIGGLSAVTFDVFVNQFLAMAALGHRLLLIDDEERLDPARLLARGADPKSAIDVLDMSCSQLEILVDAGLLELPHRPKILVTGNERASERLWQRLHEEPGLLAFTSYGVTECTVESTLGEIGGQPRQVAGRAAGTSRLYIVDDQLQLLPPLFTGEVCIGGLGVGQGYAGQPAYTSERFVADPFSPLPGQRMYRTGDKGRLRADGQLEFLGRVDDQVKVRGVRVEPGEVEAALLGHPGVARAAVVATGEGTRMAKLVACLVLEDGGGDAPTTAGVREFLRDRLPSGMLPDRVELLDAFPITANGKLDRRALAERMASSDQPADVKPSGAGPSSAEPAVASPADTRGRQLCEIVADVLDLPEAGLDDDFFALGGTSLLAMQLTSRVRSVMGCELSVRVVFDAASLRDMAARLGAAESSARPALRRRGAS